MASLVCRAFSYRFAELKPTKSELLATSGVGKTAAGYLVWRRTLLVPCTFGFSLATVLRACSVVFNHYDGPQPFLRTFFGAGLFDRVLCQNCKVPCACKAVDSLMGIFVGSIVLQVLLALTAAWACTQLALASWRWSEYAQSCRSLRRAHGALFLAPFVLLLLMPLAQFVQIRQLQTLLCREHLGRVAQTGGVETLAGFDIAATIEDVCAKPSEKWQAGFETALAESGLLFDESSGTCEYAEAAAQAAGDASGECVDDESLFRTLKMRSGVPADAPPVDCAAAAMAATPAGAGDDEVCTMGGARVLSGLFAACPASCGTCDVGVERRNELVELAGARAKAERSSSCVRPLALDAVGQLSVALSSEALIGAVGLQQGLTVLLTLLPAALGLVLGAAQGSTLAKCVLPSSRLPDYVAGGAVALGLPMLGALLAFINTLVGGGLGQARLESNLRRPCCPQA